MLNKACEECGYVAGRAYPDEQDMSGDRLHVSLPEFCIGKVGTTGMRYTNPRYVTRSFRWRQGDVFCVESIEPQLFQRCLPAH